MNHCKSRLLAVAAVMVSLPFALGQSAPADTMAPDSSPVAKPVPADRAYLGIYVEGAAEGGGVKLEQVEDDSPAAKAGLQAGDVITAIGDRTVGNDEELRV